MKIKIFGELIEVKEIWGMNKFIGLMFRKNSRALLFNFGNDKSIAIHSLFCWPFYAVWLDDKKRILLIKKVKPFTFSVRPALKFRYLVEIPENEYYSRINQILDGKIERFKY